LGRHLENGEIIWQNPAILFQNFYSYTEPSLPFVNHHWFSGIIFYAIYLVGGFRLLSVFNILLILAAFILAFNFARKKAGFYLSAWIAIPVIFLLSERVEVRPEIISYLLLIVTWLIIDHVATRKNYRLLWWLVPLFILWVNCHIYFFLGLALLGFQVASEFLPPFLKEDGHFKRRLLVGWLTAKPWIKNFIYVTLACLVNPNTWRGLLYPFNIFHNYGYEIAENKSIFYLSNLSINYNFTIFKILLGLLLFSLAINFLITRKIRLFDLFITIFFSFLALFASRNLALYGLVSLILISHNLASPLNSLKDNLFNPDWLTKSRPYLAVILLLVIMVSGLYLFVNFLTQTNFIKSSRGWGLYEGSIDSAQFFKANNLSGPIFNNYDLGSALIFWLYPQEKVFVDNRPEAYSESFFTKIYKPLQTDPLKWQDYNAQYKFKTIYFSYTDSTPWAQQFLRTILNDQHWALVYFDRFTIILVNKESTDPATIKKLSLDVWAFRQRWRELAATSDLREKFHLADLAQAAGQNDLAGEIYQEILFDYPDNRQVLVSFGYLYASSQDATGLNRALNYFNRALTAGYSLPGVYNQNGLINGVLANTKKPKRLGARL
jgi:hypothetical protein